jgi:hypothetical protein
MPHTRSAESKKRRTVARLQTKWLALLQSTLPTLCRILFDTFSKGQRFTSVRLYCKKKNVKEGIMLTSSLMSGMKEVKNYLDTYVSLTDKCIYGAIQTDSGTTWIGIPFHAIHVGLEIDKNTIDASSNHLLRDSIYSWIQDTIRGELSRRRAARIKEELVAAVWHPRRVARLLEEGGWDAVDAL